MSQSGAGSCGARLDRLVDDNLRAAMRCYRLATVSGETRELPGLSLTSSGVDYAVFNSAILTSPVAGAAELDRLLAHPGVHFQARGLRWSLWLCEDLLSPGFRPLHRQHLLRQGMRLIAEPPGMVAESLTSRTGSPGLPLEFRRVGDAQTRGAFVEMAALIFSFALLGLAARILGPANLGG